MEVKFDKIGEVFKKYRLKRGLSQQDMGGLLGVTREAYSNLERGCSKPNTQQLETLINSLKIPVVEALTGATDENEITAHTQELLNELQTRLSLEATRNG